MDILNEVLNDDAVSLEARIDEAKASGKISSINILGNCGESPLSISIMKRDTGLLAKLLDAGVDVNLRNSEGDQAMHVAAKIGFFEAAEMLYKTEHCRLGDRNADGLTAQDIAEKRVTDIDLNITRRFCGLPEGRTLDDERSPMEIGRFKIANFLREMHKRDIAAKEQDSVATLVHTTKLRRVGGFILNGSGSANCRLYESQRAYPSGLDSKPWSTEDKEFFLNYKPGVQEVVIGVTATDFASRMIKNSFDSVSMSFELKRNESETTVNRFGSRMLSAPVPTCIHSTNM